MDTERTEAEIELIILDSLDQFNGISYIEKFERFVKTFPINPQNDYDISAFELKYGFKFSSFFKWLKEKDMDLGVDELIVSIDGLDKVSLIHNSGNKIFRISNSVISIINTPLNG